MAVINTESLTTSEWLNLRKAVMTQMHSGDKGKIVFLRDKDIKKIQKSIKLYNTAVLGTVIGTGAIALYGFEYLVYRLTQRSVVTEEDSKEEVVE